MKLTQKLLGFLNRIFDKDPKAFVALSIDYEGDMTWTVQDFVLTTTVNGGPGAPLSIDLTQYTLSSLALYIAGQAGYTVSLVNPGTGGLSAKVLLDGTGSPAQSNGDQLLAYNSLLWSWMEGVAAELAAAKTQVEQAPGQISIPTSSGYWLDYLGGYYKVPRLPGEADAQYGPRIVAEVLRPRSNNVAIAAAIEEFTGQQCTVTDVVETKNVTHSFNASFNFDGSQQYGSTVAYVYGLFDVQYGYDLINGADLVGFQTTISSIIETLRSAGTHLRSLALASSSSINDNFTGPSDLFSMVSANLSLVDAFSVPNDALGLNSVISAFLDALTPPSDNTDFLTLTAGYSFNGSRRYDGSITWAGGCDVTESIDGSILYGSTFDGGRLDFSDPNQSGLEPAVL